MSGCFFSEHIVETTPENVNIAWCVVSVSSLATGYSNVARSVTFSSDQFSRERSQFWLLECFNRPAFSLPGNSLRLIAGDWRCSARGFQMTGAENVKFLRPMLVANSLACQLCAISWLDQCLSKLLFSISSQMVHWQCLTVGLNCSNIDNQYNWMSTFEHHIDIYFLFLSASLIAIYSKLLYRPILN